MQPKLKIKLLKKQVRQYWNGGPLLKYQKFSSGPEQATGPT